MRCGSNLRARSAVKLGLDVEGGELRPKKTFLDRLVGLGAQHTKLFDAIVKRHNSLGTDD